MLILPVQVIADIWEWKMTNKFFQLYHKLEEPEERYNIGIASLLVHEKGFPDQRYAFSLHGVVTIDLILNPNYICDDNSFLKEVKELMDNNNLELTQLILSSKRNNKND